MIGDGRPLEAGTTVGVLGLIGGEAVEMESPWIVTAQIISKWHVHKNRLLLLGRTSEVVAR